MLTTRDVVSVCDRGEAKCRIFAENNVTTEGGTARHKRRRGDRGLEENFANLSLKETIQEQFKMIISILYFNTINFLYNPRRD